MEQGLRDTTAARNARDPLAVAYQNAWEKLRKYYELTDEAHSIYAAAILLHPSHRKQYFDHHWTGDEQQWKDLMIQNVKKIWQEEYKPLLLPTDEQSKQQPLRQQPSILEQYLRQAQVSQVIDDEFDAYINGPPTIFATPHDCIPWLRSQSNPWPGITQHALDLLSIPAMSAELERVFSQAKLTVTPVRNALSDHVIEILELMRYWWKNNIISQPRGKRQRQQ
jgi:hAT family C-terminal dimerisation region